MVVKNTAVIAKTAMAETIQVAGAACFSRPSDDSLSNRSAVQLAQSHELPKRQVDALLDDVIAAVAKHIKKGRQGQAQRTWNSPGQETRGANRPQIRRRVNPSRSRRAKKVAFRVARDLKEAL